MWTSRTCIHYHGKFLFEQLPHANYSNKIDLKSRYCQVRIKEDVWKTNLKIKTICIVQVFPFKLSSYKIVTFMRLMNDVLRPFINL